MSAPHEDLRKMVRSMLENAPAYGELEQPERQKLARTLVDVLGYLTDPAPNGAPPPQQHAQALDDANSQLKSRLSQKQDFAGKDFVAGAAAAGTQQFANMVKTVDFPKFVSGLVEGVYTSIVNSSIKQMQAYTKMLEGVAKSVDQFAKENVSEGDARQFVQQSFPQQIQLDPDSGKLQLNDDNDDSELPPPDFKSTLGMQDNTELNEDNEQKIVLAAQLKMARQRQQLLAQMVAMGINRIIVTDGEIKASVLFDMKAKDTAQRTANSSVGDVKTDRHTSGGGWGSDIFGDDSDVQTSVSTAYASDQDKSESSLQTRANLSGSVTVKFKSETFPLEKLATDGERSAVNQKSTRS